MEHINALLISMKPLLEQYGYLALIVSIFFEGIGIPMPGQSLMIAASILASEQVMNLSMVMVISWLSCFLGNTCGYLLGYYFEGWLDKKVTSLALKCRNSKSPFKNMALLVWWSADLLRG